jgi:hypothetical protein
MGASRFLHPTRDASVHLTGSGSVISHGGANLRPRSDVQDRSSALFLSLRYFPSAVIRIIQTAPAPLHPPVGFPSKPRHSSSGDDLADAS